MPPRLMTAVEQQRFKGYFPNLNVTGPIVTGNASSVYNCISWTVGITNRWLWPGAALANFDTFYPITGSASLGQAPGAWRHGGCQIQI